LVKVVKDRTVSARIIAGFTYANECAGDASLWERQLAASLAEVRPGPIPSVAP